MARNMRGNAEPFKPVDAYEVAPHRYLWTAECDYRDADTYREFIKGVPYQPGEVVYIDHNGSATKAMIVRVFGERDRYGDRREKFAVSLANKKGDRFAKHWFYTWPGFIQRGYQLAGLAPDVPQRKERAA